MKKTLLSTFVAFAMFLPVIADESFVCGTWFNTPKEIQDTSVDGLAIGMPLCACNSVNGAALSLIGNSNRQATGFFCAMVGFNQADSLEGVQIALFNFQKGQHGRFSTQIGVFNSALQNGTQFGLINNADNNASFQLGVININKNGFFPVMLLFNFGSEADPVN